MVPRDSGTQNQGNNGPITEGEEKTLSIALLANQSLIIFLEKNEALRHVFDKATPSLVERIACINLALNQPSTPNRLQEKLADQLDIDDDAVPLSLCQSITRESYAEKIINHYIRDACKKTFSPKNGVKIKKEINHLNESIRAGALEATKLALDNLGIVTEEVALKQSLDEGGALYSSYIQDDIKAVWEKSNKTEDKESEESVAKISKDCVLYAELLKIMILEDAFDNIHSFFFHDENGNLLYVRDARDICLNEKKETQLAKQKKKDIGHPLASHIVTHYYTKLGLHYILALRTKLLMSDIASLTPQKLDPFLLEITQTYIHKIDEILKSDNLSEKILRDWFFDYLDYQIAPILLKFNLVKSQEEGVTLLEQIQKWVGIELPIISVATLYKLNESAEFLVVDKPITTISGELKKEFSEIKEKSIKPVWYENLSSIDRELLAHYLPCLIGGCQLPGDIMYSVPGIKYAFEQSLYLRREDEIALIGQTKHVSTGSYVTLNATRANVAEMKRMASMSCNGLIPEVEIEDRTELVILLNSAKGEEILGGRNDLNILTLDERIIDNVRHAAKENKHLLCSNISVNAYHVLEKNDYSGIEKVIDGFNKAMRGLLQHDLAFMSDMERKLIFLIQSGLRYFKKIESERRNTDYEVAYKIALGSNEAINGIDIIAVLTRLAFLFSLLKKSLAKKLKNKLTSIIPSVEIFYGDASGDNATGFTNYHIIVDLLSNELPHLKYEGIDFVEIAKGIALPSHFRHIEGAKLANIGSRTQQKELEKGLPTVYEISEKLLLLPIFIPVESVSLELKNKKEKEEKSSDEDLAENTESFIVESVIGDRRIISKLSDLSILEKVVIKAPESYIFLKKILKKPVHYSLLHEANVTQALQRINILKHSSEKNAINAKSIIKQVALEKVADLLGMNKDELDVNDCLALFEKDAMELETLSLIEGKLFDSLSEREIQSLNEDKAYVLIDNYIKTDPDEAKKTFFEGLKTEIQKKGFSLDVMRKCFEKANKEALFKYKLLRWKSRESTNAAQLLNILYETLPGGRKLTEDEMKKLVEDNELESVQNDFPEITGESVSRKEGVKEIIHLALTSPQDKLGAKLLRRVRQIFKTPLSTIQRDRASEIIYAESIYQTYIVYKIKEKTLCNLKSVRWDVQGHIITDIELTDLDYQRIHLLISGEMIEENKAKACVMQDISDTHITNKTICVFDVWAHPALQNYFTQWLSMQRNANLVSQEKLNEAVKHLLSSDSRSSIIPAYEEIELHLRYIYNVISDVYRKNIGELIEYDENAWATIIDTAIHALNDDVKEYFQQYLVQSLEVKGIDFKSLNVKLDKSRKEMLLRSKERVIESMKTYDIKNDLCHFTTAWEIIHNNLRKDQLALFSATGEDYFRVDARNELAVRISATNKKITDSFNGVQEQTRRIIRRNHFKNLSGISIITPFQKQQIIARVPSLAVNLEKNQGDEWVNVTGQQAIVDISERLDDSYQIINKLMGGYKGEIVYCLLTSLHHKSMKGMSLFDKKQNKHISWILQGVHLFNKYQINRSNVDSLFYMQNIPVNHFTESLSINSDDLTISEASMMADIALLITLKNHVYTLPVQVRARLSEEATQAHRLYVNYLKTLKVKSDIFFRHSAQGKEVIRRLDIFKKEFKTLYPSEQSKLTLLELITNALFRLFIEESSQEKHFGMLIQSLSMFLIKVGIVGCESGNAYHQAVSGRAELLESISGRLHVLSEDEQALLDALYALSRGAKNAILGLQKAFDLAYNKHNLYGSSVCFMEEEQNVHTAQVEGKKLDLEELELKGLIIKINESPYVTWLAQDNLVGIDAHQVDFVNDLLNAEQRVSHENEVLLDRKIPSFDFNQAPSIFYKNNSLIICLLPYLLRDIYLYTLSAFNFSDEKKQFLDGLRVSFANFIDVNGTNFSYPDWSRFLKIEANHFSYELFFIPFIRDYLKNKLLEMKEDNAAETLSMLNKEGYQSSIPVNLFFTYFAKPLEYAIAVYEGSTDNVMEIHETDQALQTVSVILCENKYALKKNDLAYLYFNALAETPSALKEVQSSILADLSEDANESIFSNLKGYMKERILAQIGDVQLVYQKLVGNISLSVSAASAKEMISSAESKLSALNVVSSRKKNQDEMGETESNVEIEAVITEENVKKSLASLLGKNRFDEGMKMSDALILIKDEGLLEKSSNFMTDPYMILFPRMIARFNKHLSIIATFLTNSISMLEKKIDDLYLSFSPDNPVGALLVGQEDLLSEIEDNIIEEETVRATYLVIDKKIADFFSQMTKAKRQIGKYFFKNMGVKLESKRTLSRFNEGICKETSVNLSMTGKPFKALDKIRKGDVALYHWDGLDGHMLGFIESEEHHSLTLMNMTGKELSHSDKMESALIMLRQLLLNMEHFPSQNNKIIIDGDDVQMGNYLWGASYLLGKTLGYNRKMIEVNMPGFAISSSWLSTPPPAQELLDTLPKAFFEKTVMALTAVAPLKKRALSSKSAQTIYSKLLKTGKKSSSNDNDSDED
jgi:hypothetical protein